MKCYTYQSFVLLQHIHDGSQYPLNPNPIPVCGQPYGLWVLTLVRFHPTKSEIHTIYNSYWMNVNKEILVVYA